MENQSTQRDIPDNSENTYQEKDEYTGRSFSSIADEITNFDFTANDVHLSYSDVQLTSKQLYKCEECDASYKSKTALGLHKRIKHEVSYKLIFNF